MTIRTAHETFVAIFNAIDTTVEFNNDWNNGTGYFNGLVSENLGLEIGTRFKSHTGDVNDRKIIGVVTPLGNAVFFERFTAGDGGRITRNLPSAINGMYEDGLQSAETLQTVFGGIEGYGFNLGVTLERVSKEIRAQVAKEQFISEGVVPTEFPPATNPIRAMYAIHAKTTEELVEHFMLDEELEVILEGIRVVPGRSYRRSLRDAISELKLDESTQRVSDLFDLADKKDGV